MTKQERQFIATVWEFYRQHGRHDLPWRQKTHLKPYDILVSEIMLQQTQVDRVIPKYRAFLHQWGSARALASAPLGDVLKAWQGLGYNRRAKALKEADGKIVADFSGRFPHTYEDLLTLPGVGSYTAGAVMAFAYNEPVPLIETNIRTVYLHHFFNNQTEVTDAELLQSIGVTLDRSNPREWFWALMDYGAYLKQRVGNNISQSKHYKKQSKFQGSDRQIRGAILRRLSQSRATRAQLQKELSFDQLRLDAQLQKLMEEEMLEKKGVWYRLPS